MLVPIAPLMYILIYFKAILDNLKVLKYNSGRGVESRIFKILYITI